MFLLDCWKIIDLLKRFTFNRQIKCELKSDEVIDFLTWLRTDFLALKMFKLKMLFNFQKPVTTLLPMTLQWRFVKQEFILFINYD